METKTRFTLLLFLALMGLAIVLLAAGLSDLKLQQGAPFPGAGGGVKTANPSPEIAKSSATSMPLIQGFLVLVFIALLFYLLISLLKRVNWRHILRVIGVLAVIFVFVLLIPPTTPGRITPGQDDPAGQEYAIFEYRTTPMGNPPPTLVWVIAAALLLSFSFIGYRLYARGKKELSIEEQVGDAAEKALAALKSGNALDNVIFQCYVQMSQILRAQRGVERQPAMTTREFEDLLIARGIPNAPVHKLTLLFEAARYGDERLGEADRKAGLECLSEISDYIRKEGRMRP